jgi:hypothetical protein
MIQEFLRVHRTNTERAHFVCETCKYGSIFMFWIKAVAHVVSGRGWNAAASSEWNQIRPAFAAGEPKGLIQSEPKTVSTDLAANSYSAPRSYHAS